MYTGYMARYGQEEAGRALDYLVPSSVIPVLRAYLAQAAEDASYPYTRPETGDYVTVHYHGLIHTVMVGPVDRDGHSVFMVHAVEYPNDGMAPSGGFGADYGTSMEYGAQSCVALLPGRSVIEQMISLYEAKV